MFSCEVQSNHIIIKHKIIVAKILRSKITIIYPYDNSYHNFQNPRPCPSHDSTCNCHLFPTPSLLLTIGIIIEVIMDDLLNHFNYSK